MSCVYIYHTDKLFVPKPRRKKTHTNVPRVTLRPSQDDYNVIYCNRCMGKAQEIISYNNEGMRQRR